MKIASMYKTQESAAFALEIKEPNVGVIPKDWEVVPVGDIFSFKNGLNKGKEYFGHGTPIVNYMDVFRLSGIRAENIKGRVNVNQSELQAYEVKRGDVFFTRTSETVDEIGISAVMLDDVSKTVFSGFILRARPKDNSLDDQFKKWCFSSKAIRNQITSKSTYTTRALTNGRTLSAVLLLRPSIAEQKKIATALNDIDDLIAAQEELIAKKRDIKQATMQQLLTGRTRLPGFKSKWNDHQLGDLAQFIKGRELSKELLSEDGKYEVILYGELFTKYGRVIHSVHSCTNIKQGIPSKLGDILIPASTTTVANDLAIASALMKEDVLLGGDINILRIDIKNNCPEFVAHYLTVLCKQKIAEQAQGITIIHLYGRTLAGIRLNIPDIEEQEAIASILSDMDAEISALEAELEKARAVKQGMMQELLTGRIRLI